MLQEIIDSPSCLFYFRTLESDSFHQFWSSAAKPELSYGARISNPIHFALLHCRHIEGVISSLILHLSQTNPDGHIDQVSGITNDVAHRNPSRIIKKPLVNHAPTVHVQSLCPREAVKSWIERIESGNGSFIVEPIVLQEPRHGQAKRILGGRSLFCSAGDAVDCIDCRRIRWGPKPPSDCLQAISGVHEDSLHF